MKRSIFMPFKRDRKKHWNRVYKKNLPSEVGWYQDYPEMSLKLIAIIEVGADGSIIDIGGVAAVSLKSGISFVGCSVLLPIITEHYSKKCPSI